MLLIILIVSSITICFVFDLKELSRVLAAWPSVWRLEMTGNTLCHKKKYRDRVLVMSRSLGEWSIVIFD